MGCQDARYNWTIWEALLFSLQVILPDTKSGKPHALHILPTYQAQTNGHSQVVSPNDHFSWSIKEIIDNAAKFRAAGDKAEAKDFENCINPPLLSGIGTEGKMIDTAS